MLVYTTQTASMVEIETDVVVVGSGPAGASFAREIAKGGHSVVVLEEGEKISSSDLPQDRNERIYSATKKAYRNKGAFGAFGLPGKPGIMMSIGIGLGGSSLINAGTFMRAPENLFKQWKEFGLNIDYAEIDKIYDEIEKDLHVVEVDRNLIGKHANLFLNTADGMGLSCGTLKRAAKGCKGCGQCTFICPEDAKQSMHISFIPEAQKIGAKFFTRTKAKWIEIENGKAVGIEGEIIGEDGDRDKIRVRAKVVALACGTIYTPSILMKNRLGNFSGQVGKNLSIHPALRVSAIFDERLEQWTGVSQAYYIDEFASDGILIEGITLQPPVAAMVLSYVGAEYKRMIKEYANMMSVGAMVSDTSRGIVIPVKDEVVVIYNLNRYDALRLKRAVEEIAKIFFEAGAKKVLTHIFGIEELNTPDDIKKLQSAKMKPTDFELMALHPLGTCRMGNNPRSSVVNQNLESHDIKNLFIVDGSVFPTPLEVNPQETIIAFAIKAARHVLDLI